MAISWGPEATSSTGGRGQVGIEGTLSGGTITWKTYFHSYTSISYNGLSMSLSGAVGGSHAFNISGTGVTVHVATVTSSVNPGASASLSASVYVPIGGRYTASHSLSVSRPAIQPNTPSAPSLVANGPLGVTASLASWPANNGAAIDSVYWETDRGQSGYSGTNSWHAFTGLAAGTSYRVQCQVRNSAGWSPRSAWSNAITTANVPSAPASPTVSGVTSTVARGTVAAPSNNGATVVEYGWQLSTSSSFSTISQSGNTTGTTWDVSSLSGGVTYYMRVRARNAVGWGAYSAGRSFTTGMDTPTHTSVPVATRTNDNKFTITWTNNPTSSAPYTSVDVYRWDNVTNTWGRIIRLGATATTYIDESTIADRRYQWATRAVNDSGESGSGNNSAILSTTPATPTNCDAQRVGSSIKITWNNVASYTTNIPIEYSVNGVWQGTPLVTLTSAVNTHTHNNPDPTKTYVYRVRAVSTNPVLYSGYSVSDSVQLESRPNIPVITGPIQTQDRQRVIRLEWVHNPTDTSAQRQYAVRYRVVGSSTWNTSGTIISGNSWHEIPANTYTSPNTNVEWQVQTWGSFATASEWSPVSQFRVSVRPIVTITTPTAILTEPRTSLVWTYNDATAGTQTGFEYELYDRTTGSSVLVSSEYIGASSSSHQLTHTFIDKTSWSFRVRAQSSTGLWSDWDDQATTVNYLVPAKATGDAEWIEESGYSIVNIHNPIPNTGVATNDILNPKPAYTAATLHATNLAPNGGFEYPGGEVVVQRNEALDPGATAAASQWAGWAGNGNVARNEIVPAAWSLSGTARRLTWTTVANAGSGDVSLSVVQAAAPWGQGQTVTVVYRTRVSRAGIRVASPGVYVESGATITPIARSRNVGVGPAPDETLLDWITFLIPESVTANIRALNTILNKQAGDYVEQSMADIYYGSYQPDRPWFSGSYSPDPDLTARWTGTANASTSELVGVLPLGPFEYGGTYARRILSEQWADTGSRSVRIVPYTTSNDTYCPIGRDVGGLRLGMVPGQTYTAIGVCKLTSSQEGTLNTSARRLVFYSRPDVGSYTVIQSDQPPNEPGVYPVRLTFTVPPDATEAFIRAYNGASAGNGDVWWDSVAVVPGVYDGPFFDGDTPRVVLADNTIATHEWLGIPGQSATQQVTNHAHEWKATNGSVSKEKQSDGSYEYLFYKPEGSVTAEFEQTPISATNSYATFSSDVLVEEYQPGTRVQMYAVGAGTPQAVPHGQWSRVSTRGDIVANDLLIPRTTIRGTAPALVRARRLSLIQSEFRDDFNAVYFDGDSEGAAWQSGRNNSPSNLTSRVRTNRVYNPSFDTDTSWWTAISTTHSRSTDALYVYRGAGSLQVTGNASGADGSVYTMSPVALQNQYYVSRARITAESESTRPEVAVVTQFYKGSIQLLESPVRYITPTINDIRSDDALVYSVATQIPTGTTHVRMRVRMQGPANYRIYMDDAQVIGAATPTSAYESASSYFDSSSVSFINKYGYTVNYSQVASLPTETFGTSISVVSNAVYRRINGGPWTLVMSGVPVNGTVIDYQSGAGPVTEYRIDATTSLPSVSQSDPFELEFPDKCAIGVYLSAGPGMTTVAGMLYDISIEENTGFANKELYWFAGRTVPEEITTPGIRHTIRVSGVVVPKGVETGVFASPETWHTLAKIRAPHLYRDGTGRYLRGSISDVSVSENASMSMKVSFTITEAD